MSKSLIALLGALALVGTSATDADARTRKKSSSSSASKSSSKSKSKSRKKRQKNKPEEAAEAPDVEASPPKPKTPDAPANPEQAEADRHFKSGVTLYKEGKFNEALAEFERAYEIAPHPLVLYNIAGCHRELSNYAESVKYSRRFLEEGKGVVSKARLAAAQNELDAVLARIARVTVTVTEVEGAELILDGVSLGTMPLDMPLVLPPGEHRLVARAEGYRDAERAMRLASGDELEVSLTLAEKPPEPVAKPERDKIVRRPDDDDRPRKKQESSSRKRFSIGGGYASNLRDAENTGAGTARLAVRLGSRFELGVEGIFVAYAVVPSLRFRLFGDTLQAHLIGAAPVSLKSGDMDETFVAGAGGLGLRLHVTRSLALRLEGYYSYAGEQHGTTYPAFIGGELWF